MKYHYDHPQLDRFLQRNKYRHKIKSFSTPASISWPKGPMGLWHLDVEVVCSMVYSQSRTYKTKTRATRAARVIGMKPAN
jgi:hypothetical protein